MQFFTSLIKDQGGATECNFVYSFGASDHGKRLFDGIGTALENNVHSLIKETKSGGDTIPRAKSGYIAPVEDVHDALKEYFENGRSSLCRNKAKNKADTFIFLNRLTCDNPSRQSKEIYVGLEKINSCYQPVVTNADIVQSRMRSCWFLKHANFARTI